MVRRTRGCSATCRPESEVFSVDNNGFCATSDIVDVGLGLGNGNDWSCLASGRVLVVAGSSIDTDGFCTFSDVLLGVVAFVFFTAGKEALSL